MADIKYIISVDEKGAVTGIKNFSDQVDKLGESSKATDGKAGSLFATIAGASIVADLAGKAMGALTDFVSSASDEFLESEKIQHQLNATMKNLGIDTDANSKRFDDFADAIMAATTVDDDMVKSLVSLGLRMGISDDQIESATTSAIGLSKAFGVDLEAAMKMVAQATEGSYDMMGRYLPQLKGAETGSEKAAIAAKAMADGFKIAQAETQTIGGKMEQAKNEINNAKEGVGEFTAKLESMAYKALVPATKLLTEFIDQLNKVDQRDANDRFEKQLMADRDALEAVAKTIGADYLAATSRVATATLSAADASRYYSNILGNLVASSGAAARAYNAYEASQKPVVNTTKDLTLGTGAAAKATKTLADEMGIVTKSQVEAKIAKIEQALKKYHGQITGKEEDKLRKELKDLNDELFDMEKVYKDMPTLSKNFNAELLKLVPTLGADKKAVDALGKAVLDTSGTFKTSWHDAVQSALDSTDKWLQGASQAISAISGAIGQHYQNKAIAMDNDYQKQLETIKNSKMSEEEKQIAITALEADYQMKRRELAKKEAEAKKATAIVESIINVAQGVTAAWKLGPILGPIMAAIVAAAGLVQISKIKSSPIPLAQGAIFKQPTFLTSPNSGQQYQVAEAGEAEIISNGRQIREAIFGKGGGNGGRAISLVVPIYVGGKKIEEHVIRIVEDQSQLGRLRIAGKAVN
jgi:hypothetical protein